MDEDRCHKKQLCNRYRYRYQGQELFVNYLRLGSMTPRSWFQFNKRKMTPKIYLPFISILHMFICSIIIICCN